VNRYSLVGGTFPFDHGVILKGIFIHQPRSRDKFAVNASDVNNGLVATHLPLSIGIHGGDGNSQRSGNLCLASAQGSNEISESRSLLERSVLHPQVRDTRIGQCCKVGCEVCIAWLPRRRLRLTPPHCALILVHTEILLSNAIRVHAVTDKSVMIRMSTPPRSSGIAKLHRNPMVFVQRTEGNTNNVQMSA